MVSELTSRTGMDVETQKECPNCGRPTLSVYYEENTDLQLGAVCSYCGLKGFYMNGKLLQLA